VRTSERQGLATLAADHGSGGVLMVAGRESHGLPRVVAGEGPTLPTTSRGHAQHRSADRHTA
jgi:hypothetical protein